MIEWIVTNIEDLSTITILGVMTVTTAIAFLYVSVITLSQYKWFRLCFRPFDNIRAEQIAVAVAVMGVANIIVPVMIVYIYLTVTGMPFIEFLTGKL